MTVPNMVISIPSHHKLINTEIVSKFGSEALMWLDRLSILYPRDDVTIGQVINNKGPMDIKTTPSPIFNFRFVSLLFMLIIISQNNQFKPTPVLALFS